MKKVVLLVFVVFFVAKTFAQSRVACEKIVNIVVEAVSQQNIEQIKPYLSDDFKIAGQSSPIAEKVLEQLVRSLGKIKQFNLTEEKATDEDLTLNYDIEYEKFGKKQASFVFDQTNKIKRLDLLKIEVKTAKMDTSKIEYNPSNVIEIPFTKMGNLIVVQAYIDGKKRDFILDSGSGFTLINSKYIEKDTSHTQNQQAVLSSAKGVHNESLSGMNLTNTSIDFYGIRVDKKEMLTIDISHLERDGRQIYGLIGFDFLSKYDVLYDYAKSVVVLINPDYFQTYRKEKLTKYRIETLPIEWVKHIPVVETKINDDYYKMGIDCGAGVNLLDASLLPKVKGSLKKITTKDLSGASKNKKQVTHAQLKKHYVGTTPYKNTQIVFNDIAHLNKDKEIKIDGILGYEFLSKCLVLISHKRKELLIIR